MALYGPNGSKVGPGKGGASFVALRPICALIASNLGQYAEKKGR